MSVNRFKTMKPMLLQSAGAVVPTSASLTAFGGLIVDLDSDDAALIRLVDVAKGACHVFTRIASINHATEAALVEMVHHGIDGVVLAGCRNRADIQRLDVLLRVAEAHVSDRTQPVAILAEYGTLPESVLSPISLDESSARLEGLLFDSSTLAAALGCASVYQGQDDAAVAPIAAGRAAAVLRAREAGLGCYEMLPQTAMTDQAVRRAFSASRACGFSSVVCRSTEQAAWLETVD